MRKTTKVRITTVMKILNRMFNTKISWFILNTSNEQYYKSTYYYTYIIAYALILNIQLKKNNIVYVIPRGYLIPYT